MKRSKKSQSGQILIRTALLAGSGASFLCLRCAAALHRSFHRTVFQALRGALGPVITLVSGFAGVTTMMAPVQQHKIPALVVAHTPAKKPAPVSDSEKAGSLHHYVYAFEGKATYNGQPSPRVHVMVRINSSQGSQVKSVLTDGEGNYSVSFNVGAAHNEPVRWSIEAYSDSLKRVKLAGQRIAMREEDPVTLKKSVEFAIVQDKAYPDPILNETDRLDIM